MRWDNVTNVREFSIRIRGEVTDSERERGRRDGVRDTEGICCCVVGCGWGLVVWRGEGERERERERERECEKVTKKV